MTLVYLLKQNWLSFFRKLDRETNRPNVVSAYWEILVQVTKRKEVFLSDLVTLSGKKTVEQSHKSSYCLESIFSGTTSQRQNHGRSH